MASDDKTQAPPQNSAKPAVKAKKTASTPEFHGTDASTESTAKRRKSKPKVEQDQAFDVAAYEESLIAGGRKLDAREARFVEEYLLSLDPKDAALKAGYSRNIALTKAYSWVSNGKLKPHVYAAVMAGRAKAEKKLELTREACLEQYRRLAFADPRRFFDENGQLKSIHELDDETAAGLQGFEVEMRMLDGPDAPPVPVLKVKWSDRKAALDSIFRAQGWNKPDKVEMTGKNGGPIETQSTVRVVLVPPKEKADVSVRPIGQGDIEG